MIGLNDFHGNLMPPSGGVVMEDPAKPKGTTVSAGGAAYLATLINSLKAQNPGNTLVVAAGDMIGASPLISGVFHDEPTIDVLGKLGLDISAVGNHEFDKGRDEILRMQNGGCFPASADGSAGVVGGDTCMDNGSFSGAKFHYLTANVVDKSTGKPLFPAYEVRTVGGVKIGFIGLTLEETPTVVTASGVAGLRFLDEITTVNNLVPELKKQGVSAIVVLLHNGGRTKATFVNDKTCPGLNGDIVGIVDKLDPAVDVVISGHTHQEYVCTRNGKLLTQTGLYGRIATKVDLTIDPVTRTVLKKDANNIVAVNDVGILSGGKPVPLPDGVVPLAKDSEIDALVQNYEKLAAPLAGKVVGKISESLFKKKNTAGESTLGDVIADAFLFGTSDASFDKPAQIAFTNGGGGFRSDLKELDVTLGALYSVLPFSNSVVLMDLTGNQLLRLLEQQWEAPNSGNGRVLEVSDGFTYTWDVNQQEGAEPGTGKRVDTGSMQLNGSPIEMDKIYRVAVNDYIAGGGSGFTVLLDGANLEQGGIDLDIVAAYFEAKGIVAKPTRLNRIKCVNKKGCGNP